MMSRKLFVVVVTVCAMALVTVTTFAQLNGSPVRADIPFNFTIRGTTLPAGEYEISRITDTGGLEIANVKDRHEHVMIETEPAVRANYKRGELDFHRYGDTYFLYRIWTPGLETGRQLPISHQEKEMRREANAAAVASTAEPQTVVVAIY
jgi:hypothetical protein